MASGKLRAEIDGSGGGGGGAWLTRRAGTSKAGQTNGRADRQADGPHRAWLVTAELLREQLHSFSNYLSVSFTVTFNNTNEQNQQRNTSKLGMT